MELKFSSMQDNVKVYLKKKTVEQVNEWMNEEIIKFHKRINIIHTQNSIQFIPTTQGKNIFWKWIFDDEEPFTKTLRGNLFVILE